MNIEGKYDLDLGLGFQGSGEEAWDPKNSFSSEFRSENILRLYVKVCD